MAFYAEELAEVHDEGFGAVVRAAAPWILARLATVQPDGVARNEERDTVQAERSRGRQAAQPRASRPPSRGRRPLIVELGCGGGRLAQALSRRGFDVHGIDASRAFIRLARRRVPSAKFTAGKLPRVAIPHCHAVLAVGEVVNYLTSLRDLGELLRRVHHALVPGGVFIFDGTLPLPRATTRQRCLLSERWVVIADISERGALLERRITTFSRRGRAWRRSTELHRQRLLTVAQWRTLLRRAGFAVEVSRGYGQHLNPRARVFVATKMERRDDVG